MPVSDNADVANLSAMPSTHEVEGFTKKVDEVSILIDGLQRGTISPAYIDSKFAHAKEKLTTSSKASAGEIEGDDFKHRRASVQRKIEEIKANLDKKRRARERYEEHIKHNPPTIASTDYIKWDFWCPEDDEDELVASCTPDNAQLQAMEKDINDRHARIVRERQRAERCRKAGIEAYRSKQWSKAYLHFDEGCSAERSNANLHSNAAMAAIKMGCYAQAIEHCEKVIRLHDFLLEKPEHPMVVKAWQRMAAARVGLKHFKEAAEAMEAAVLLAPDDFDIIQGAQRAQQAYNEQKIVKHLTASKACMKDLQTIESLACALTAIGSSIVDRPCKSAVGVAALRTATVSPHATDAQASHVKRLCDDLVALLRKHDDWRVYFRSCGGLQSVACLLSQRLCMWKGRDSNESDSAFSKDGSACNKMITACANLLNEACQIDTNGRALSGCDMGKTEEQQQSISADLTCEMLLSQCCIAAGTFEAISMLLHTLTTDELSRQKVARAMLLEDAASPHDAVDCTFRQLVSLEPVHRALTVALLSNCLTVDVFATRVSEALGAGQYPVLFHKLLQQQTNSCECKLVADFLANAATSPTIRSTLACKKVLQLLVGHCSRLSVPGSSCSETQALVACLTCLYNIGLSREAPAVSDCLNADSWIHTATHLMKHDDTIVTQLAACIEARHVALLHADSSKIEVYLARRMIATAVEAGLAIGIMPDMHQTGGSLRDWQGPVALKLIDAVIRMLAGLGSAGHVHVLKSLAAVELLAWAICTDAVMDVCAGNAALCIGFIADDESLIPVLRDRSVVTSLVDMAYKRHGSPASRNAAITAAKLAQDPSCLQEMRDCHGFEKIHKYIAV